jgi:phosphate transport system protein
MSGGLRHAYHAQLEEIDTKVTELFALVIESLAAATDTFLAGDRATALEVKARDSIIDALDRDIEVLAERAVLLQAPVASELRFLLSVLRIVPELERSGDLAEHIASRAAEGLGTRLTAELRGLVEEMGSVGLEMWRATSDAYADRDPDAVEPIDRLDDRVDDLHDRVRAVLEEGKVDLDVALDMALVARFYERLGDHALHISERVRYMAVGRDDAEV